MISAAPVSSRDQTGVRTFVRDLGSFRSPEAVTVKRRDSPAARRGQALRDVMGHPFSEQKPIDRA